MLLKTILSFLFLTLLMGLSNAAALVPRGRISALGDCNILSLPGISDLPDFCTNSTMEEDGLLSTCACLAEIITKCYTGEFKNLVCKVDAILKIACDTCGCSECGFGKPNGS